MAVEILAGYGMFRLLTTIRFPLAIATFLAVVIGLGCGTLASYGVIAVSAPTINMSLSAEGRSAEQSAHLHEATGHKHEDDSVERASHGGHLNLRRLAIIMFGFGAIGWVLEGILSAVILVGLRRIFPEIIAARE
jgi:hypothetical protein